MKAKRLRRAVAGIGEMFAASACVPIVPAHTLKLCFDGGCWGEQRHAYGSYAAWLDDVELKRVRCEFADGSTCNVGEWMALLRGIEFALTACDPAATALLVRGDSVLVVNGAARRWKVKASHLRPLAEQVWQLSGKFASADFQWWGRDNSVRILGH